MTRKKATSLLGRLADIAGSILGPILHDEQSAHVDPAEMIREMKWPNVQLLLAEAFRREGYWVKQIGGDAADMVLMRLSDETKYLVDCRHWQALEVGANAVGELYGTMGRLGAKGGFVVTAGKFTTDAQDFARGLNVELIEGRRLAGMLEMAKETISGALPVAPLAPENHR